MQTGPADNLHSNKERAENCFICCSARRQSTRNNNPMAEMDDTGHAFLKRSLFLNPIESITREGGGGGKAKRNVFTAHYYLFLAYFIPGQKEMTLKEDKRELTQFVDVDGFAAHAFPAFTHGFDLNQIVAVGVEGELHSGFVGEQSGDVVVVVLFQEHLRREKNINVLVRNYQP